MKLPPRMVRRVLIWPIPLILVVLYVGTIPLLITLALLFSYRLPGKLRLLRALGLFAVYLFAEAAITLAALGLWVMSGFGWKLRSPWFQSAHYWMLKRLVTVLVGSVKRLFTLEIDADGPPLEATAESGADEPEDPNDSAVAQNPIVVLARHAGPADSLLVLHQVMSWQERRPRIVAKDLLQLDPALDILLNRLPNRFISPNPTQGQTTVEALAELAAGMKENDAFVIFPEGGNFTEKRRVRAIERLRRGGYERAAQRASELRNVLPPRPAGTTAVLAACPAADVVFVAHTGLDQIASIDDVWTALPERKTLEMKWYVVASKDVPDRKSVV